MSAIIPDHTNFSVIDLSNAFFCIPLDEKIRAIFAFTFQGKRYQYTRLPQGFLLSPGIFNQALKTLLSDLVLPDGVVFLQYVDDFLLAAPSEDSCLKATHSLLLHLHSCGFKVSKSKLQMARMAVTFLGRLIASSGTSISATHQMTVLYHPKPQTVKQMLSFLGLTGYSRQFIPDYTALVAPLRALIQEQGRRNLTVTLNWVTLAD